MWESHSLPRVIATVAAFLATFCAIVVPGTALLIGAATAMTRNPGFFTDHVVTIEDHGVAEETRLGRQFVGWQGIVGLRKSRSCILIYIAGTMAHFIPRRAFEDYAAYDRFYQVCRERVDASKAAEGGNH